MGCHIGQQQRCFRKLMFQVVLLTAFVAAVAAFEEWPTESTERARRNALEPIPTDWSPGGRGVGGRLDAIIAGLFGAFSAIGKIPCAITSKVPP